MSPVSGRVTLLSETSVGLSSGGKSSLLSAVLLVGGDPVNVGVSLDGLVLGVNHNNFKEFVGTVLTNPVGVEDSEVVALSANSLFGNSSVGSLVLELDTLVNGLSVNNTLGVGPLSSSSPESDSVDNESLLGLISEHPCLIGSRGSLDPSDGVGLSVLPCSDSEHESHNIGLLLSPEFFKIFVGSHKYYLIIPM